MIAAGQGTGPSETIVNLNGVFTWQCLQSWTGAIGVRMARRSLQMGLKYSGLMYSLGYGARYGNVDFNNT